MKYKMIPVEKFWKEFHKGKHQDLGKTLVLVDQGEDDLYQEFAYVMNGFFDSHRQGGSFRYPIKFVLVKYEKSLKLEKNVTSESSLEK